MIFCNFRKLTNRIILLCFLVQGYALVTEFTISPEVLGDSQQLTFYEALIYSNSFGPQENSEGQES